MYILAMLDKNNTLLHAIFYEEKPNEADILFAGIEIASDEDFTNIIDNISKVELKEIPNDSEFSKRWREIY